MCLAFSKLARRIAVVALFAAAAVAADPQPYDISISATGDGQIDGAVHDASLLAALRSKTPAPAFALLERARGDVGRIETVLQGFGYYKGRVTITIDGRELADKALPGVLEAIPQGQTVAVKVAVVLGPRYTLRKIEIDGEVPPDARRALQLQSGEPAVASHVLAAQARLLSALQEDGYAFAEVDAPVAFADDAADTLDVSFKATTGAKAVIGPISFKGLKDVNESFVRQSLSIRPGQLYQPSAIEAARAKLVNLGVFSGVTVHAQRDAAKDGAVPLVFDVEERPHHSVALSAAYSTDLGVSLSAAWSDRNLLGNAEQLNLSASAIGLGGTATAGLGYNLTAQFIKPRLAGLDQEFESDLGAVKQHLDAYSQTAESFTVLMRRKFSSLWTGSGGTAVTHDFVAQEGVDRTYELVSFPVTAIYDSTGLTNPLADPVRGARATIALTPAVAFGHKAPVFAILQATGSLYFDLSGDGRSVLATRALIASIQGGRTFDLPPDQRIYAGGSGTVRGFRYQSIGPHFADGSPTGSSSIDTVSVELRQRLWSHYGFAAFVDAGQASTDSVPFNGPLAVGAGVGARYYTSIGAIRLDVAVPVTKVVKGDAFEVYVGIGQAF